MTSPWLLPSGAPDLEDFTRSELFTAVTNAVCDAAGRAKAPPWLIVETLNELALSLAIATKEKHTSRAEMAGKMAEVIHRAYMKAAMAFLEEDGE